MKNLLLISVFAFITLTSYSQGFGDDPKGDENYRIEKARKKIQKARIEETKFNDVSDLDTLNVSDVFKKKDVSYEYITVYCQAIDFSTKIHVKIEYKGKEAQTILNNDGSERKFNSNTEILNILGSSGWELVSTAFYESGYKSNCLHYFLKRKI